MRRWPYPRNSAEFNPGPVPKGGPLFFQMEPDPTRTISFMPVFGFGEWSGYLARAARNQPHGRGDAHAFRRPSRVLAVRDGTQLFRELAGFVFVGMPSAPDEPTVIVLIRPPPHQRPAA